MSTSDRVRAILGGTIQAYRADPAYRERPDVHNELDWIGRRLNQPIRIALAGTLKAGKSTLVNALVGEDIAPTDATEATRIVTWFRNGPTPKVTANHRGGRRSNVPIARDPATGPDVRLRQPRPRRRRRPRRGVARRRTHRHHDHRHPWHVVAVPRRLRAHAAAAGPRRRRAAGRRGRVPAAHAERRGHRAAQADRQLVGGSAGALGVIGVASRADEIGAGRIDAMLSAKDVATRFTAEMDKTGICQAVVPVSGLLALTARTLRQSEFVALREAGGRRRRRSWPRRCCRWTGSSARTAQLPVDAATRAALLDRFGMFGIRISIAVLRAGISDSVALADELLERSGLIALRDVIDQQFAQRSDLLKAHTALLSLRRFVEANPIYATPYIIADIDPLLADTHAFEELRLLSQLRSRPTTLNDDEMASLRRIIGGSGTDAASRLGLQPDAPYDGPRAAFAAAQRWRRRADHPLNDPFTTRACRAAVRSAEAMVADFAAQGR